MEDSQTAPALRHAGGWLVLACVIMMLGMCHWLTSTPQTPQLSSDQPFRSTIDINRASAAELCCIPQVGPSLAQKIIDYRQAHGPFHSLADLDHVPGIGPNLREEIAGAIDPLDE